MTADPGARRRQLRALIDAGKHRDAIQLGRQLLSQGAAPEDAALLAEAYRGRIMALANKGLDRDALVIMENMHAHCPGSPPPVSWLFGLLIRLEHHAEAARWFMAHRREMTADQQRRAEEFLACCLLLGRDGLAEIFPAGSPMADHVQAAAAALAAMNGDDQNLIRDALQGIGLRSPLRHLRLLLAALHDANPQEGSKRLDRIPSDSCFFPLVALLRLRLTPDDPAAFTPIPPSLDKTAQLLTGIRPAALYLLAQLPTVGDDPLRLLKLLERHEQALTPAQLTKARKQLLIHLPDEMRRRSEKNTTFMFDDKKYAIILGMCALSAEVVYQDPHEALDLWQELSARMTPCDDTGRLAKAMILRRIAHLNTKIKDAKPGVRIHALHESLRLDPKDGESWLSLIRLIQLHGPSLKASSILNEAVAQLPEDVDILLAAMEGAIQRNSLKKAEGLAKRLLKLDPINTRARQLLARAGLGHGRKLAKQGKLALARKQFHSTDVPERQPFLQGRPFICEAMALFAAGQADEGRECLERGLAAAVNPFFGAVLAAAESSLHGAHIALRSQMSESLKRQIAAGVDRGDILRLADWLHQAGDDDGQDAPELLGALQPLWEAARSLDWSMDEALHLCRACRRRRSYASLAGLAKELSRTWPDNHELRFLAILGRSDNGGKGLSAGDTRQLKDMSRELPPHHPLREQIMALLMAARQRQPNPVNTSRDFKRVMNYLLGKRDAADAPARKRKEQPPARPARSVMPEDSSTPGDKRESAPQQLSLFDPPEKKGKTC